MYEDSFGYKKFHSHKNTFEFSGSPSAPVPPGDVINNLEAI